jgi:hypothetical protein
MILVIVKSFLSQEDDFTSCHKKSYVIAGRIVMFVTKVRLKKLIDNLIAMLLPLAGRL